MYKLSKTFQNKYAVAKSILIVIRNFALKWQLWQLIIALPNRFNYVS